MTNFLVSMWLMRDFEEISKKIWDWLDFNLALVRIWEPNSNIMEDSLDFVPQWVRFHGLPPHLWGMEAVRRIVSVLRNPLFA